MKAACLVVLIVVFSLPTYSQSNRADSRARYHAIISAKQKYQRVIQGISQHGQPVFQMCTFEVKPIHN